MRLRFLTIMAGMLLISLAALMGFISTRSTNAQSTPVVTVRESTESDGTDFKDITVTCPEGMTAISGGAGIFYDDSEGVYLLPRLISSFMYPDDNSWFAEAVQPRQAATDWRLEVHVTCIDA